MSLLDVLLLIIALLLLFTALSIVVLTLVWIERKFLGRLQRRLGPTRTGPFGLIQPIADAVKLVLKEDLIPSRSEKAIFWVAPLLVLVPSFMIWVTIPAAKGLVLRNLELGLFVIVALLVVSILGLLLAGWGSANKYGALGGLRSAAQLVSYEVPLVMVVVSVAILVESLDLRVIAASQVPWGEAKEVLNEVTEAGGSFNHIGVPLIVIFPLGAVLFLIAGLAEVGRIPFDIYFAESEIVGGPFVEYSGAHWSVFFLAEYINTFLVGALAAPILPGRLVRAFPAGVDVVPVEDLRRGPRHLLGSGDLPPPADRPADGLRLEGDDSAILRGSCHLRGVPVLRLACLDSQCDVSGRAGCDRILVVPKVHSAGGPAGKDLRKAPREGWKC